MKAKKKQQGTKARVQAYKKRSAHIGTTIIVAILIAVIAVSSFLIYSPKNPSPDQTSNSRPHMQTTNPTSPLKAAIADHLSLTCPNQTFIQKATNILKKAGYTVDYYPGEEVTVEFYRSLPTLGYKLIILRVHSTAASRYGTELKETSVALFTSEPASTKKYLYEKLTGQLCRVFYLPYSEDDPSYFGIDARFVRDGMNGRFDNTVIIMMGCEGLINTEMARAFHRTGAKVYMGWTGQVSSSHTDRTTIRALQHLIIKKQTIDKALEETLLEMGPDPTHKAILTYYPLEAGEQTIEDITGNQTAGS